MLAPSLAVIALVAAYPIIYAIWLSLNEYSVITPGLSRFVGLDNYIDALGSSEFWEAMKTTVLFTVISVGLELVIGLAHGAGHAPGVPRPGAAAGRRARALGDPHRGHRDHLADDLRTRTRLRQHDARRARRCRAGTSSGSARKATRWR